MALPQIMPQKALLLLCALGAWLATSHVAASVSSSAASSAARSGADSLGHATQGDPAGGRRSLLEGEAGEGTATVAADGGGSDERRLVIGITATYTRAFQVIYINHIVAAIRSAGTPFLWIVVEGAHKTEETARLLERTAARCLPVGDPNCETVNFVHLAVGKNETSRWNKAVLQRNKGLEYVEEHKLKGTIYFMDDDNTYHPMIFEELRKVKRVAVFPVGFLFSLEYGIRHPGVQHHPTVERPLVRKREQADHPAGPLEVYGWETFEWSIPKKHGGAPRTFCTDMAGFAFNSELLWTELTNRAGWPKHPIRFKPVTGGYLETIFLGQIIPGPEELEPLCNEARQVWVWHSHGEAEKYYRYPEFWKLPQPTDLVPITVEGTTWNYVIGNQRYGIKGMKHTDLRPGYKETGVPAPRGKAP